ncbi:hypothetical protein WMF30_21710 [Sorangium sp. So ce134]
MRHIVKGAEPATVTETRTASTTDLSTTTRARTAFDQIDKGRVRADLAREQGWLCAFCMRRIDPDAADARGERTMKIAHRTPIDVDPAQALSWRNLLGSCDGGQRSGWRTRSCDAAQGSTALAVDPAVHASCIQLRYERRDAREGLFITSDHPGLKTDVEQTLGLNSGDLPVLREQAWKAFCALQQKHAPKQYGRPARAAFFPTWIKQQGARLPEMLGVIEERLR